MPLCQREREGPVRVFFKGTDYPAAQKAVDEWTALL